MFEIGRLLWLATQPNRLALILLCIGVVLLFTRRWRAGRTLLATLVAISLCLGMLPLGDWMAYKLSSRFPHPNLPDRVEGLILVGGDLEPEATAAAGYPVGRFGRMFSFMDLARRYPEARQVFTGGSGNVLSGISEADVVPKALRSVGFDPSHLVYEAHSRNTHENAVFTADLVKPKPGETWILITSAAHMPRAVGVFRKAGFTVIPYPVDPEVEAEFSWVADLNFDSGFGKIARPGREFVGLLAYWLLGYSDSPFPGP